MILGIDPSVTSTGMALVHDGVVIETANIKSTGRKGATYDEWMERIDTVFERFKDIFGQWADERLIELCVIESPSHGSRYGNPHERAGLWWDIYRAVNYRGIPIKTLAPKSRAKFITGNGSADKKEVLAVARERWGEIKNHDIADACGLAFYGEFLLEEEAV